MIARWRALAWSALILLSTAGMAHGRRESPADQEIARAIARGVDFLKASQTPMGTGMTRSNRRTGWASRRCGPGVLETAWPVTPRRLPRRAQSSQARKGVGPDLRPGAGDPLLGACAQGAVVRRIIDPDLGHRLSLGDHAGSGLHRASGGARVAGHVQPFATHEGRKAARRSSPSESGDNSNTQFALLDSGGRSTWFRPRRESRIDRQSLPFTQLDDGHWDMPRMPGGGNVVRRLDGTGDRRVRPSLAERQTARARGAALAATRVHQA